MSLYASREGALYSSYDNYAGAQGFYQPQTPPHGGMPAPPAGLTVQADDPYAHAFPQQSPQRMIFHEFQQMQPEYQPQVFMMPKMQTVQRTVMLPMAKQQQIMQPAPVAFNQDLRGVGIKFGERMDPQSGGVVVFVKRVVPGGPAEQSGKVTPGDVLLLINSQDVYGMGLEHLRDKIPGPAGTGVSLGFRNVYGQFYEVNLARTAYGGPEPVQVAFQAPMMQMQMPVQVMPEPVAHLAPQPQGTVQYVVQQPQPRHMVQYVHAPPLQQTVQVVRRAQPQPVQYVVQQQPFAMPPMQPPHVEQFVQMQPQFQEFAQPVPVQYQQEFQQPPPQFAPQQPYEYQQPPQQQYEYQQPPQPQYEYQQPPQQQYEYQQPPQEYAPPPPPPQQQFQQQPPQQYQQPQYQVQGTQV